MKQTIDLLRDRLRERSEENLVIENSGERISRWNRQELELINRNHVRASQTLLARIRELHTAGRSVEEIVTEVLTTEPENARFRAAMLVDIILLCARRRPEEMDQ